MRVIPPRGLRRDEQAVAALPPPASRGGESWNRRLNLWPGRDLTAAALAGEQRHRERHVTRLGRSLSPGVVEGLEVALDRGPAAGPDRLVVGPGRGLLADGQDVVLAEARAPATRELVTLDAATPLPARPGDPAPPPSAGLGVLLLVPVLVQQEAEAERDRAGAFAGPCADELSRIAFTDFRRYDATLLAFHPWPWPDAVPPPAQAARRRNLLADAIFRREAAASADDRAPLPWNAIGVALALLELDAAGRILFLDRAAVVRKGGAAPLRRPAAGLPGLPAGRGTPFLWQARLQQLAMQATEELAGGWDGREAASRFRVLPPAGVLPRAAWDAGFFPEAWLRLAAPVPVQQLELAIAAAAGLAPFDLDAAEAEIVKWLIPVPEEAYEPGLLQTAHVDPAFDETVAALLAATSGGRARRDRLRALVGLAVAAADPGGLVALPATRFEERVPNEDPQAPPDPPIGAEFDEARIMRPLETLIAALVPPNGRFAEGDLRAALDPANLGRAGHQGLGPFAADLELRLEAADDRVDLGFTRLQAEIYRIRQVMLDNEEASKLATSPVLAGIVKEGVSAFATNEAIKTYFRTSRTEAETPALRAAGTTAAAETEARTAASAAVIGAPLRPTIAAAPSVAATLARADLAPSRVAPAPAIDTTLGEIVREGRADLAREFFIRDPRTAREAIRLRTPIPGEVRDFRTVTIADRLRSSAAVEAKSAAVRLKGELIAGMRTFGLPFGGLPLPLTAPGLALLPGPEIRRLLLDPLNVDQRQIAEQRVVLPRSGAIRGTRLEDPASLFLLDARPLTREELGILVPPLGPAMAAFERGLAAAAARRVPTAGLDDEAVLNAVISGRLDPDPPNGDEAAFLSAAVAILEGTVGVLRALEGRIVELRALLDRCRTTLAEFGTVLAEWRAALAEADRLLAERRHDVTVARALRAEEQARIDGVNRRRQEILATEVRFVGFARPRLVSPFAGRALPRRPLPGRLEDPVLPCLDAHGAPPEELERMLGVLREVPLGWLKAADALLDRLDRPGELTALYLAAIERARIVSRVAVAARAGGPATRLPGAAAATLAAAWEGFGLRFAAARAEIDPRLVLERDDGWRATRRRALRELSLDDLIAGAGGARRQPALVRAAAEELERLERVATCLFERLGGLPVAVRLAWVQTLSLFDATADLSRLELLPRFGEVPAALRRELVRLVAWLFDRLTPGEAEARGLMSDIVRVAILLAGHAPVAALVGATLARDFTGGVGDVVTVRLPAPRVRVGMAVEFRTPAGLRVAGVVEDFAEDGASVRVTRTPAAAARVAIPATSEIRLFETPAGRGRRVP